MIPGITSDMEARLLAVLDPRVTDLGEETLGGREFTLMDLAEARRLGVQSIGSGDATVVVTNPDRALGDIRVQLGGTGSVLFFDNQDWSGGFEARIRLPASDCLLFFNDIADRFVALNEIFLRSSQQMLFWGMGASAVGLSVEMEGDGHCLAIGDDALISGGVWARNYDMHAMHDLATGALITKPPVDMVVERHVWLGQDALLLGTERVGMGAIVGARALVKRAVPPRVVVAGTPARVIRENVSWGRHTYGMVAAERVAIGLTETPNG
jgi:hypothetical protein